LPSSAGRDEQLLRRAAAHIAVVGDRRLGGGVGHDPGLVVERARGDAEAARADRLELVQVRCDGRVDRLPFVLQVIDRHRLRALGHGVVQRAVDIGAGILVDQGLRPRAGVDGIQRGGVAVARVEEVAGLAVAGVAAREAGQGIGERDLPGDLPAALAIGFEQVVAAVLARAAGHAHLEVRVGDVAGDLPGVLLQQRALPAGQVHPVQIVPLRVAVVHRHQHRFRVQVADPDDLGAGGREIAQVARLAAGQVHREQVEVLVAAGVTQVQQGVGTVAPEVLADATGLVRGDRARLAQVVGRGDPDVEHAVDRGDPAQVAAVGADLHVGTLGVAEQGVARDQPGRRGGRTAGGRCGRGVVAGRRAVAGGKGQGEGETDSEQQSAIHGGAPVCRAGGCGHASAEPRLLR